MNYQTLSKIIQTQTTLEEDPFDFRIVSLIDIKKEYPEITTDEKLTVFAMSGDGSSFAFWGEGDYEKLPIIYVSSEGQTGKIANNIIDCVQLIIELPQWASLSHMESLEKMNKWSKTFEEEYLEFIPDFNEIKQKNLQALDLKSNENILEIFFQTCAQKVVPEIYGEEKEAYESIFD